MDFDNASYDCYSTAQDFIENSIDSNKRNMLIGRISKICVKIVSKLF